MTIDDLKLQIARYGDKISALQSQLRHEEYFRTKEREIITK